MKNISVASINAVLKLLSTQTASTSEDKQSFDPSNPLTMCCYFLQKPTRIWFCSLNQETVPKYFFYLSVLLCPELNLHITVCHKQTYGLAFLSLRLIIVFVYYSLLCMEVTFIVINSMKTMLIML